MRLLWQLLCSCVVYEMFGQKFKSIYFQIIIKYFFTADLRAMIDVANKISVIHKKNALKTTRDHKLCEKYANLSQLIAIGIPIWYYTLTIGFQLPTVYDIISKGIIRPSMHIYLPGANESNMMDMSVLCLLNFISVIFGMIAITASDTFVCINFATIPMYSAINQRQIKDFKNQLKNKKIAGDSKGIKKQLIGIMQMQLKYNK